MEHIVHVVSYEQLNHMIRSLDLYSRIYMGQYDDMMYRLTGSVVFSMRNSRMHRKLCDLRDIFIPALKGQNMNSSLGIWGEHTPKVAMRAYDIQQCLRYQLAHYKHQGDSGYTVDFRPPYIHGQWDLSIEDLRRYHEMLVQQGLYPDYRPGFIPFYPWFCPVIISRFGSDSVDIEWSEDVCKIVNDSEHVLSLLNDHRFTEIFEFLYPDISKDLYEKLTVELTEYFDAKYPN